MATIEEISDFGIRFAATPTERKVRDYLSTRIEALGLSVAEEPFEFLRYLPRSSEVRFSLDSNSYTLKSEPLQFTKNARAEGEPVFVGNGSRETYESLGLEVSGKVAVTTSPFTFLVYGEAQERGAAAVLFITDPPQDLIRVGTATNDRTAGTVPGALVGRADGDHLLSSMSAGNVRVIIESSGEYSTEQSANLIVEIPGTSSDKAAIICCHYDSQIKGGAWDNATGCASVLELARNLREASLPGNIFLAWWSVEEQGLCQGSRSWRDSHPDQVQKLRAAVNLDGFGTYLDPINILWFSKEAEGAARTAARFAGFVPDEYGQPLPLSDHRPFEEAGVPVVWAIDGPYHPYYHTEGDTSRYIDPERVARIAKLAGYAAVQLLE